jgi:hypothetical protein
MCNKKESLNKQRKLMDEMGKEGYKKVEKKFLINKAVMNLIEMIEFNK